MKKKCLMLLVIVCVLIVTLYIPSNSQTSNPNTTEVWDEAYQGPVEGLVPYTSGYDGDWKNIDWSFGVSPTSGEVCSVFYGVRVSHIFNATPNWFGATDGDNPQEFFATPEGGSLYRINPNTQTVTAVGNYGGPAITELAYKEINDILYGTDYDSLYIIDLVTGVATLIGPHNLPTGTHVGVFWAMDYHAGLDKLFAVSQETQKLYEVNEINGNITEIGATGAPSITDLWYDKNSGNLYAVANAAGGNKHFIINPNTGTATVLAGGADFGHHLLGLGDFGSADGPSLTQWGLITLLVIMAGIATWVVLKRRRVVAA